MSTAYKKFNAFVELLGNGGTVDLHLDPRKFGVKVPAEYTKQYAMHLQYGMNMAIPIPDLMVRTEGVYATLSFNRVNRATFVPWHAVFLMVSGGQNVAFSDDAPREILVGVPKPPPEPTQRTPLRLIKGGKR